MSTPSAACLAAQQAGPGQFWGFAKNLATGFADGRIDSTSPQNVADMTYCQAQLGKGFLYTGSPPTGGP